jgi:hypothetical protein
VGGGRKRERKSKRKREEEEHVGHILKWYRFVTSNYITKQ